MKIGWAKLGGQLGIGYCLAGLVLVFLGWNGAASYDRVPAQMPYLVSGGIGGLALVVIGAALIVAQSNRADRVALQGRLDELTDAIDRLAEPGPAVAPASGRTTGVASGGTEVVAGPNAYHRTGCHLLEGQEQLVPMSVSAARARGLSACRICGADVAGVSSGRQ